eukprot:g287.t1
MLTSSVFVGILSLTSFVHGGMLWSEVCTQAETKSLPFCDMSLSVEERAADYTKRVSLADKAANMVNSGKGIPSLSIPPYQWGSEGLHGPLQPCVCDASNVTCKCPTSFPCPSALGTAFNDSLYFLIGKADGREARAINNLRNHVTQNVYGDGIDYWSPTLNMQRDPRWGRNQEVPGEDPMLTGNYASNFVQGLQGEVEGLDNDHVQIAACCKHFIANSLEDWEGHTRYDFDAHVPLDDLMDYYLPPFRSCVMEGRAKGVMCSYNAVTATRGNNSTPLFSNQPSCANTWLLNTLRDTWKFDGYVTSDCGAIQNECDPEPKGHGVYNCTEAAAASIKAGTDVDCGGVYGGNIVSAVNGNLLKEEDVDAAFARLTKQQMLLGLFDNDKSKQPYFNLGIDDIDTSAHQQLALEAAHQSIVLLKNDGAILPLKSGSNIAVIGPHFNATKLLVSNYHGSRCLDPNVQGPGSGQNFDCIVSPLRAIALANSGNGWTKGAQGCDVASNDTSGIAEALSLAKSADTIILAVGIDQTQEREGLDRTITTLPGVQLELIDNVMKLAKGKDPETSKTVILVTFSGGAMSLGALKDSIPAIISAGYGGEMGGRALSDVLFGKYSPSGKLAATWYPSDYVNQIPLTEMSLRVAPGRTFMYYTGTPEFPFGHGLSYSSWDLSWNEKSAKVASDILVSLSSLSSNEWPILEVRIANKGEFAGRQTALLFWEPVGDHHPAKKLKLQKKLVSYVGTEMIPAGEERTVSLMLNRAAFEMHQEGIMSVLPGDYILSLHVGGSESEPLQRKLRIVA